MNLHHKSTYNLKIPGVRRENFSSSLSLEQKGSGAFGLRPLVVYISLLCKWMLGFYLAVLNTGAQVLLGESHSSSKYTLNGISCLANRNPEGAACSELLFLVKAEEEIPSFWLFACLLSCVLPLLSLPCDTWKLKFEILCDTQFQMDLSFMQPRAAVLGTCSLPGRLDCSCRHS